MTFVRSFLPLVALAGFLWAGPVLAEEESPEKVSDVAGGFAGVAESCGLDTAAYSKRVAELLRHLAGESGTADQLIANFDSKKSEIVAKEENERSIDCMDAKRRFEELPINQPGWTVETGWASEML